ncbi:hypothetical protein [Paenibacillus medicaginis]|uniref:Uncharacterized protein n=1 Tax=Paenibacillus medicaginis TaxID=1470560 RepID=A0ABV5BUX6_9BACL
MTRRTKKEMELMKGDATYYLLQTILDPHKAWDMFIKYHLENSEQIPYYIKGIKDFITVSEQLKLSMGQVTKTSKDDPRERLSKLTMEQFKESIQPLFKTINNREYKISLVHLYDCINSGDFSERMLSNGDIHNLELINIYSLFDMGAI